MGGDLSAWTMWCSRGHLMRCETQRRRHGDGVGGTGSWEGHADWHGKGDSVINEKVGTNHESVKKLRNRI